MVRLIGAALLFFGLSVAAASANAVDEMVIAQLTAQGYTSVTVGRTWLGRIIIVGQRDGVTREIVLNPYTGELLRDYSRGAVALAQERGPRNDAAGAAAVALGDAPDHPVIAVDPGPGDMAPALDPATGQ